PPPWAYLKWFGRGGTAEGGPLDPIAGTLPDSSGLLGVSSPRGGSFRRSIAHDDRDDFFRRQPLVAPPCACHRAGSSRDCRGAAGARSDRLARRLVAFPLCLTDLDAM